MSRSILFEGADFSKIERDALVYWLGYLSAHLYKLVEVHVPGESPINSGSCAKCYSPFPCAPYLEYEQLCQLTSRQGQMERAYEHITGKDL